MSLLLIMQDVVIHLLLVHRLLPHRVVLHLALHHLLSPHRVVQAEQNVIPVQIIQDC